MAKFSGLDYYPFFAYRTVFFVFYFFVFFLLPKHAWYVSEELK
jgi:hypothetical protein